MQRNRNLQRRGVSLILMLTTIAAGAVIVGLAVLVLIRVMGFNSATGEHLARTVVVAHLAEHFRSDAAAARWAEVKKQEISEADTGDQPNAESDQQKDGADPNSTEPDNKGFPHKRLTLTLGEQHTITYDIHNGAIDRTVTKNGQRLHSEHYALAGLAAVALEVVSGPANAASPPFATLRLDKTHLVESHLPQPARSVVIEAQVGCDHRFAPREVRQ